MRPHHEYKILYEWHTGKHHIEWFGGPGRKPELKNPVGWVGSLFSDTVFTNFQKMNRLRISDQFLEL
jgi:hypothetical protein